MPAGDNTGPSSPGHYHSCSSLPHFSASDTGIGIPLEQQDRIVRPFEQAESATTHRLGGTGLGLAISRQLVEMVHGHQAVGAVNGREAVNMLAEHEFDVVRMDMQIRRAIETLDAKLLRRAAHTSLVVEPKTLATQT